MSDSSSDMAELIELGSSILRESFEALHSTVSGDLGKLRRVGGSWPSVLLSLEDLRGHEVQEKRRRFTSSEITRAEIYCDIYTRMEHYTLAEKKSALMRATHPNFPWSRISGSVGLYWVRCRNTYSGVIAAFTYAVSDRERISLGVVSARARVVDRPTKFDRQTHSSTAGLNG